jgi:hypothetical protein
MLFLETKLAVKRVPVVRRQFPIPNRCGGPKIADGTKKV